MIQKALPCLISEGGDTWSWALEDDWSGQVRSQGGRWSFLCAGLNCNMKQANIDESKTGVIFLDEWFSPGYVLNALVAGGRCFKLNFLVYLVHDLGSPLETTACSAGRGKKQPTFYTYLYFLRNLTGDRINAYLCLFQNLLQLLFPKATDRCHSHQK